MGESIETILVVASAIGVMIGGIVTTIMRYQDRRRLRGSISDTQRSQLTVGKNASLEQIISTLIERNIALSEQQKRIESQRHEELHANEARIKELETKVLHQGEQLQQTLAQIEGLTALLGAATAREASLTHERDSLKRQNDLSNMRISELEAQVRDLQTDVRAERFARESLFTPFLDKLIGALNGQKVELVPSSAAAAGAVHHVGDSASASAGVSAGVDANRRGD